MLDTDWLLEERKTSVMPGSTASKAKTTFCIFKVENMTRLNRFVIFGKRDQGISVIITLYAGTERFYQPSFSQALKPFITWSG